MANYGVTTSMVSQSLKGLPITSTSTPNATTVGEYISRASARFNRKVQLHTGVTGGDARTTEGYYTLGTDYVLAFAAAYTLRAADPGGLESQALKSLMEQYREAWDIGVEYFGDARPDPGPGLPDGTIYPAAPIGTSRSRFLGTNWSP